MKQTPILRRRSQREDMELHYHLVGILLCLSQCGGALSFTLGLVVFFARLNNYFQETALPETAKSSTEANRTKAEILQALQVTNDKHKVRSTKVEVIQQPVGDALPNTIVVQDEVSSIEEDCSIGFVDPPSSPITEKGAENRFEQRIKSVRTLSVLRPHPSCNAAKPSAPPFGKCEGIKVDEQAVAHQRSFKQGKNETMYPLGPQLSHKYNIHTCRVHSLFCSAAASDFPQFP